MLGWSPVARKCFGIKRTGSDDRIFDGGRAKACEEAICAVVFAHAEHADWFRSQHRDVDKDLLSLVKMLANKLEEVRSASGWEWERAILAGFRVWNQLVANDGGIVVGDLRRRTLDFRPFSLN